MPGRPIGQAGVRRNPPDSDRLFRTFLHGRAGTHAEGPKALFDHAMGWLRRNRVLLPGVSVLARQVSEVRKVADERLHATVAGAARRAGPALPGDLVATLKTAEGSRFAGLERLRRPPTGCRRSRRTGWRRRPGTRWGPRRRCWGGRRSPNGRRCSPR
ncbi:DUF4158 domain-containing protein [Streptomyces erythrochromogenes]|nr:DUF4158 domain-containing protein [Streptomyces erythrochromogenes]